MRLNLRKDACDGMLEVVIKLSSRLAREREASSSSPIRGDLRDGNPRYVEAWSGRSNLDTDALKSAGEDRDSGSVRMNTLVVSHMRCIDGGSTIGGGGASTGLSSLTCFRAGMTVRGRARRPCNVLSLSSNRKYWASPLNTPGDMKRWLPSSGGRSALLLLLANDLLLATDLLLRGGGLVSVAIGVQCVVGACQRARALSAKEPERRRCGGEKKLSPSTRARSQCQRARSGVEQAKGIARRKSETDLV